MSAGIPQDLLDYLQDMILPPDGEFLVCFDLGSLDLGTIQDNHFHAAIVQGAPTPEQVEAILRVLRPGAHVMLFAPDSEPTGHTGACNAEDGGFEVRDAIAWARRDGVLHYVPKVKSKKERHGGTGGENNDHPTIKPVKLMARLLEDIPTDKTVGDFFLGSGSTGCAVVQTGHDFIGMELEAPSLAIADQRIRHADAEHAGWNRAEITSDHEPEPDPEPIGLADLFGWGDDE